uniref:Uncharacterized protein n=1 Tax=Lepeophtheirus salmonis TaxID=72036 RepID=A0A0K2TUY9_LEPSM
MSGCVLCRICLSSPAVGRIHQMKYSSNSDAINYEWFRVLSNLSILPSSRYNTSD